MRIFVQTVSLLLLSSCGISREHPVASNASELVRHSKKKQHNILAAIKMQEAKQTDIPLPVSAKPLARYYHVEDDRMMLGYRDYTYSIPDLVTFYKQEMERLGWDINSVVSGHESMLQCSKPNQWCIVSVRPHNSGKYIEWVIAIACK